MDNKNDFKIDPNLEDDTLMFHLTEPKFSNIEKLKKSNSYYYIRGMIDRMRIDYGKPPKRIGFVGDEDTIVLFLVILLDEYACVKVGEYFNAYYLMCHVTIPTTPDLGLRFGLLSNSLITNSKIMFAASAK